MPNSPDPPPQETATTMTPAEEKPHAIAAPAPPKRRANDAESVVPAGAIDEDDPEHLYRELRAGKRSIESLAPLIPLNVAFLWQTQRRINDEEFAALMAGLDVQHVDIGDLPRQNTAAPGADSQRADAVAAAFQSKMNAFDIVTLHDAVTEIDMKPVLSSRTPLVDGIGIRMAFAKGPEDGLAKPGTPPGLTLLCRAYIASVSMQSTLKCEALFSALGMERDLYCRLVVPLPIHKGGRRRLLVSILDNETRQPVSLPPEVAEFFHEKNLFDLRLLMKSGTTPGGVGSAVKGAFGRLFKS